MERVCPICNKLKDVTFKCDICGGNMIDRGRVQDYSDAYSNQQEINDTTKYCIHLFKCDKCNNVQNVDVDKVNI